MKFSKVFTIFSVVVVVECIANIFEIYWLQFLSKPSLMLILLTYFLGSTRSSLRLKYLVAAALSFSWLGDVLLLIEKQDNALFVYGLIAFLGAHICYVVYFWRIGDQNCRVHRLKPMLTFGIVFYSLVFYSLLFPFLGGMKFPVVVYSTAISLMLIASFHAFDSKDIGFAKLCIAGTLLFVLSDSILAVNRFVFPLPFGSVFVMLTYAIGQLLITEGVIRNLKQLRNE